MKSNINSHYEDVVHLTAVRWLRTNFTLESFLTCLGKFINFVKRKTVMSKTYSIVCGFANSRFFINITWNNKFIEFETSR